MNNGIKKGLVIIYTGNGKGKTTAALGMLLRAWGQNLRVAALQFVKSSDLVCGEHRALQSLGLEIVTMGSGFTWAGDNAELNHNQSMKLWNITREKIKSGNYDMLILDEFTYPLKYGWIQVDEALNVLRNRPPELHVIITGRDAPQKLISFADTAIEVRSIKHHLKKGIKAQPGIEY